MSAFALSDGVGAEFGLIALRTRRIARAGFAVGSLSLVFLNAVPIAVALSQPAPAQIHTLASLSVPTFRFPVLQAKVASPTRTTAQAAPAHLLRIVPARHVRLTVPRPIATHPGTRTIRVPVVNSSYVLTKPPPKPNATPTNASSTNAASKFSGTPAMAPAPPPVVESSVGTVPPQFATVATAAAATAVSPLACSRRRGSDRDCGSGDVGASAAARGAAWSTLLRRRHVVVNAYTLRHGLNEPTTDHHPDHQPRPRPPTATTPTPPRPPPRPPPGTTTTTATTPTTTATTPTTTATTPATTTTPTTPTTPDPTTTMTPTTATAATPCE